MAAEGPDDFDFLFGSWRIHNRRLVDPLDESAAWSEFEAASEAYPILRKLGNVQLYDAPNFPGRPGFQGYALRLFDPKTRLWRIWWASTAGLGQLDNPVIGSFRNGMGRFERDDTINGREIGVRFLRTEITDTSVVGSSHSHSMVGGHSCPTGSCSISAYRPPEVLTRASQ